MCICFGGLWNVARLSWIPVAEDGERAARLLADGHNEPDLIVLDLNLPKLSGLEVLKRFRESGKDHVPVLIFSSSERPSDIDAALAAGAMPTL